MKLILGSLLLLVLGLSSCGPAAPLPAAETLPPPPASATVAATAQPQPSLLPFTPKEQDMTTTPVQLPPGLSPGSIEWARQDLAKRLGLPVEDVSLLSVTVQDFPAEAFYCRAAQDRISRDAPPASISGFSILLRAGMGRYEYHARQEEVFFCRVLR